MQAERTCLAVRGDRQLVDEHCWVGGVDQAYQLDRAGLGRSLVLSGRLDGQA